MKKRCNLVSCSECKHLALVVFSPLEPSKKQPHTNQEHEVYEKCLLFNDLNLNNNKIISCNCYEE